MLRNLVGAFFCCACATPKPASARKTPARTINRPIKTRRLKKADCEVDFFFIGLIEIFSLCVVVLTGKGFYLA